MNMDMKKAEDSQGNVKLYSCETYSKRFQERIVL